MTQFITEADLDGIIGLPDGVHAKTRVLTLDDFLALAEAEKDPEKKSQYRQISMVMAGHGFRSYVDALKAGIFPGTRYKPDLAVVTHLRFSDPDGDGAA